MNSLKFQWRTQNAGNQLKLYYLMLYKVSACEILYRI